MRTLRCLLVPAAISTFAPLAAQTVSVAVDPGADRRPIDPRIYGVNFGDPALHADLHFPVRRWGGNSTTRYNWTNDVHNTAADYFFQNIAGAPPGSDSESDVFVDETFASGGEPILTVPLIGWTPLSADRDKRWGFSVAKYGPQDEDECSFYAPSPPFWCTADSGDGRCATVGSPSPTWCSGGLIVGNDPADTSEPIDASFVTGWMAHVAARVGNAAAGGVRLWALDNEPMLWWDTHRDVAPVPLDYDGLWSRTVQIAAAIKAADPGAKVLGPVVWGWCAYFTSADDAVASTTTCLDGPDRQGHGGLPLLAWYLDQVCAYQQAHGVRLIDYLDVHYYPQGTSVDGLGGAGEDAAGSARRLRALRELWDPTWVAESWIGEPVDLVPRLRGWIAGHCPGIGIALTEYRWGTDNGASSALAHAEALAIFGREGVDIATRWEAPAPGTRVVDAFRLFLDYDGLGARVVGDSARATSSAPTTVGAYAVVRGGDLLVLLFNHDTVARQVAVTVSGGLSGSGRLFRFDPTHPLAELAPLATTASGFSASLPARSASLVVVARTTALFADGFETGNVSRWSASKP